MRKALSSILVLILLLGMVIPASAAGTPTLSISSGEVKAGESVTLTVSIENNPGIAAVKYYLYYDTDVFDFDPEKGIETVGAFKEKGTLAANTTESARENGRYEGDSSKDGLISIWVSPQSVSKDGEMFEITLNTTKDVSNGDYEISLVLVDDKVYDQTFKAISVNASHGRVTVTGGSGKIKSENEVETAVSGLDRLQDSIVLRIGSFGAVSYGSLVAIDADNHSVTPMINSNDRTLVPLRFVAESLGADVKWDGEKRQVTISLQNQTVVMTIGSREYTIDGVSKMMDTAPEIVPQWDRTMVPIRFVAEALGMAVEWDAENRLVLITPALRPWNLDGAAEAEAVSEVYQLMMLQSFL